jgi:opacity protein-like surface antigen
MTHRMRSAFLLAALWFAIPAPAFADGLFTPWLGVNFANAPAEGRTSFGFSVTGMAGGVIGGEFDFGYSPNFFGDEEDGFGSNNVLTMVGNLVVGIPLGGSQGFGVRPYVTGGIGLIRSKADLLELEVSSNDFGINAGGGVYVFFGDRLGLRGDLRYFRAGLGDIDFLDTDNVDFWRASIGLTIR